MIEKKLNFNSRIAECLPVIQEIFLKYYGEEYREKIEKSFKNCTYLGYYFPEDLLAILQKWSFEKSLELVKDFLKKNGIEDSEENICHYFKNPTFLDLRYPGAASLDTVFSYLDSNEHSDWENDNFINILKAISGKEEIVKGSLEYQQLIERLMSLKPSYDEMYLQFEGFCNQYRSHFEYLKSCEVLKRKIHNKYQAMYLKEIYEYLDEHDKALIKNVNFDSFFLQKLNGYEILFNSDYISNTLLDSFSKESEEFLAHPDPFRSFKLMSIYRDRIKYFKKKGIDLGDDYQEYEKDERCAAIKPNLDFVEKILKIRRDLREKEEIEYKCSTSLYQEQLAQIESLDLLDKNTSYRYDNLSNSFTGINPNIRRTENGIELYCLLLFPLKTIQGGFDAHFIHECNHLVETEFLGMDGDIYKTRSGWDSFKDKINVSSVETENKISRRMMNEIINELIAQEITQLLHDEGFYLFDSPEDSRVRNNSNYESCRFLVNEFFEIFKKDIVDSRVTGNMDSLFEKIGKENFDALNQLVNDFFNYFDDWKIYRLRDSLRDGIRDENVDFYYDCIAKRDVIMQNMKENAKGVGHQK